jgi:hypothetical protein
LTLSGSNQLNHSHTTTGSLPQVLTAQSVPSYFPQSKYFVTVNCQEGINSNFRQTHWNGAVASVPQWYDFTQEVLWLVNYHDATGK